MASCFVSSFYFIVDRLYYLFYLLTCCFCNSCNKNEIEDDEKTDKEL